MNAQEPSDHVPPDAAAKTHLAHAMGAILRSKRAFYAYTQQEIEQATQIHRTRVGRFERGTHVPDVWEAVQLALLLQMPLEELLQPCIAFVHSQLPPK
jgi:transcriptional regulator with XRE-family HTH domain